MIRMKCKECLQTFSEDDVIRYHDSNPYCEHCFNDMFTVCDCCGEYFLHDDMNIIFDSRYVCEQCYNEETQRCDICEEMFYKEELQEADDNHYYFSAVCEECMYQHGLKPTREW
ncbi:MAG: hypothetical protein N2043_01760 [Ignavibacterium sp.]|nr:hypothetical protein [Ignavibacterium sp.]